MAQVLGAVAPLPPPSAGPPERRSLVPPIPSKWIGKIILAVLVAVMEVVLSETTMKKR